MTDRKYYLWLIPGVLVLGMVFALVFAFQPVFAGSAGNLNSINGAQEAAVPQVEVGPACTPNTTGAISYWSLNEFSGPTYTDTVGGYNGSCSEGDQSSIINNRNYLGRTILHRY